MKQANYIYFVDLATSIEVAEPWIQEGFLVASSVNHYDSNDIGTGSSESIIKSWLDNKSYSIASIVVNKAESQFLEFDVAIDDLTDGERMIQKASYSGRYYIEWAKTCPKPIKLQMSDTPHPIVQC